MNTQILISTALYSTGNYYVLFIGHNIIMSFLILLLVRHLLTDHTLKKITTDKLGTFSVIVSDHYAKLAGHFQN